VIERIHAAAVDAEGATMVEYALLICLCALLCLATVTAMGGRLALRYNSVAGSLTPSDQRPGCQNAAAADRNPNC